MSEKEKYLKQIRENIQNYCDSNFDFSFKSGNPAVRLHEPTFGTEEIYAAVETMLSTYTTMGKKVREFEKQFADYAGNQYGVMSNSGSSANLLAIAALANPAAPNALKPGDEVIVPALSWATTIWPIIQYNLVPVFVDCDLHSLNFDLKKLEKAITPKTRAIMLVHVYGNPCPMDEIMALAKKHNLLVIEDCCEAMGAFYDGKSVGSFGDIASFSFFFSHHITTLEGGISVTNNFDLCEMLRILRAHGWSREADSHQKYVEKYPHIDPRFIFINLGYNLRPTEVQAAMGQKQLPKLNQIVELRRNAAQFFLNKLGKYAEFFNFQQETPKGKNVWFGFPIILKENVPFSLREITQFIQSHGIETRPIIAGNMARHPALEMYTHRISGSLEAADTVMQRGFAFACHHAVDQSAQEYIVHVIDLFMQKYANKNANTKQSEKVV